MIRELLGIEVLATEVGMKTLYQALSCGQAQVMVVHGQVERIKQRLREGNLVMRSKDTVSSEVSAVSPADSSPSIPERSAPKDLSLKMEQETLRERASTYFKQQLSALIKLPMQRIELEAPLENYGFDSIMAVRFTNALEESFGPLSKTLLFEYPTLQSVCEYFLESYPDQLRRVLQMEEDPTVTMSQVTQKQVESVSDLGDRLQRIEGAVGSDVGEAGGKVGDIAIIGVAGRYPGARDLRTFWENLRTGKDCITEIPPERWDYHLYFDPDKNKPGTTCCKWGGFLEGVDEFDPLFFNISSQDAERMDPQARLFLECAIATLEDAGYTRSKGDSRSYGMSQGSELTGNVGVFVGVMYEEYQLFGAQAQIQGRPIAIGGHPSAIANGVSYFCNFHGPSLAVDSMSSSSLTAIHLACHSIQHGDCELALAGGVNVLIHPNKYLLLGQGKFISSLDHCESFGPGAEGYVPAEGVGAILLKPLAQAEADGDHIYGVIKATAINHGGKTNNPTIPNPHAQADMIRRAIKDARIDPRTISYIEAHGIGTKLGDPIEIAALSRAFGAAQETEGRAEYKQTSTTTEENDRSIHLSL
jgi:3-oxoacyl-(acyl-carrier-protein) synthase/acyl carrier protein